MYAHRAGSLEINLKQKVKDVSPSACIFTQFPSLNVYLEMNYLIDR
jgi:hypothetical protein